MNRSCIPWDCLSALVAIGQGTIFRQIAAAARTTGGSIDIKPEVCPQQRL
jgi:hypothetical protein